MAASRLRPWLAGAAALGPPARRLRRRRRRRRRRRHRDHGSGGEGEPAEGSGETLTLGYSAWPGWFPLAVAEEAGIFEELGLDVELTFFADYLGSLDAMAAGQLDGNTQTLNDTMFGVAAGGEQVIVVINDNSTGNDAIICDESITSIEDLEGKTVAAEAGVVDHFLLLQGLDVRRA